MRYQVIAISALPLLLATVPAHARCIDEIHAVRQHHFTSTEQAQVEQHLKAAHEALARKDERTCKQHVAAIEEMKKEDRAHQTRKEERAHELRKEERAQQQEQLTRQQQRQAARQQRLGTSRVNPDTGIPYNPDRGSEGSSR